MTYLVVGLVSMMGLVGLSYWVRDVLLPHLAHRRHDRRWDRKARQDRRTSSG